MVLFQPAVHAGKFSHNSCKSGPGSRSRRVRRGKHHAACNPPLTPDRRSGLSCWHCGTRSTSSRTWLVDAFVVAGRARRKSTEPASVQITHRHEHGLQMSMVFDGGLAELMTDA